MQLIFFTHFTPKEYQKLDDDFPCPRPQTCLNPACGIPVPPKAHNFYQRNVIHFLFTGRIKIRRYYCRHCGMTFSYLPSFCLPYFQYSLPIIFLTLWCHFFKLGLFLKFLIRECQFSLQRQHRQFYVRRFVANLKRIQTGLRDLIPGLVLPDNLDKEKGAQKVLSIIQAGFAQIRTFSPRFFAQCNRSFMAPCKLF